MYNADDMRKAGEADNLPSPSGYKILIAMPTVKDTTAGGLHLPDELKDRENTATIIGYVVKVGPDAYKDEKRFPSGPWCKEGDFIVFRSYSGTRMKVNKQEYRLINDDTVEAVVVDPDGYERAF